MFKKILKRTFQVLLLAFIVIQFFRPVKNKAAGISTNDISTIYPVPENVQAVLKTSCYDCHSNNTVYPWYAEIQPVAWWLSNHVKDGKKDLNFSEFASYSIRRQYRKLEEINDLVKKGEMPLDEYLWIHKYAKLSEQQKLTIANWVVALRDTIKATYPADSLVRKK
jgi:hypothetical protein